MYAYKWIDIRALFLAFDRRQNVFLACHRRVKKNPEPQIIYRSHMYQLTNDEARN